MIGLPKRLVSWLVAASFAAAAALAQAQAVPALRAHVNDYAAVLPAERAAALEARLADYEARTKHQLALLTIPSLAGGNIEDFGIRAAQQWKLGQKGADDGLILIVVPAEHKMRIEVGYGLEGVIPDAVAARVIRDVLAPSFRQGDFAGGIDAAFGALMHAASPELGAEQPSGRSAAPPEDAWSQLAPLVFPLLFFLLIGFLSRRGGGGLFQAILLGSMLGGGRRRGGGWGGGGGGGWGGGGGGGFGGGGASGNW
jgi:uncharacterized protein